MRDDWDKFDRDFDKMWKRTGKFAAIGAVVYLGFVVVGIWAIIRLVLHFT